MRAVNVRIRHDDDLVVTRLGNVKGPLLFTFTNAGADGIEVLRILDLFEVLTVEKRQDVSGAPVEDGGRSYLEISLARGKSMAVGRPNHAGRDQDYYDVLEMKPYRIEVWLRSVSRHASIITAALALSPRTRGM